MLSSHMNPPKPCLSTTSTTRLGSSLRGNRTRNRRPAIRRTGRTPQRCPARPAAGDGHGPKRGSLGRRSGPLRGALAGRRLLRRVLLLRGGRGGGGRGHRRRGRGRLLVLDQIGRAHV